MWHIIYFLVGQVGDDNNSAGVANATAELLRQNNQQVEIISENANQGGIIKTEEFIINLKDDHPIIIISSGDKGIPPLIELEKKFHAKVFIAWSGHQLPNNQDLSELDQIALPIGTASPEIRARLGNKLIEIIGVPHNTTKEVLDTEYRLWQSKLPKTNKKKLMVILSGDAPNDNGIQQIYSAGEAVKLAKYVAQLAKKEDYYIFVTNGPRTGKFNPKTLKEYKTSHREEINYTIPTDPVSKAFVTELKSQKANYYFADFRYPTAHKNKSISNYNAVLNIADLVLVPGESTSMISEVSDFNNSTIVYFTNSMNHNHYLSLEKIRSVRKIDILDQNFKLLPSSLSASKITKPAAQIVAESIIEKINDINK